MPRRAGFTLLEICLAIVIALIIFAAAIPSISGLFAERKLKKSFEEFDDFVHRVQVRSVEERRAFVLIWDGQGITVEPDEPTAEDHVGENDYFAFSDGTFALERTAVLLPSKEKPPVEWLFWRSGTCEPANIHFEGEAGSWTARYDPLTVHAEFLDQATK